MLGVASLMILLGASEPSHAHTLGAGLRLHAGLPSATAPRLTLSLGTHQDTWSARLLRPAQTADESPPAQNATPATETETTTETPTEATPEAPQCDIDCETAREDADLARYVMRHRGRTLRTHRAFAIATWATMLATLAVGTIQAANQDTWFGRGNCASDPDAFGCRQSSLLTGLHLGLAIGTTALYTTTGVLAVAAPDPQRASEGDGSAERTLRLHKTLAIIHATGMILMPLLGLLSARPQILGINDQDDRAVFGRAMRTMHIAVGYTTFAALTFAGALEF